MRRLLVLVASALALVGCGSSKPTASASTTSSMRAPTTTAQATHDLKGTLVNYTGANFGVTGDDPDCMNYDGTSVTVTNQDGQVIGSATLGNGQPPPSYDLFGPCTYAFDAGQVSANATFYGVKVGSLPATQFSAAQVRADHWAVQVTKQPG